MQNDWLNVSDVFNTAIPNFLNTYVLYIYRIFYKASWQSPRFSKSNCHQRDSLPGIEHSLISYGQISLYKLQTEGPIFLCNDYIYILLSYRKFSR